MHFSGLCWLFLPILPHHRPHPQVQPVGSSELLWLTAGDLEGTAGGLALAQG